MRNNPAKDRHQRLIIFTARDLEIIGIALINQQSRQQHLSPQRSQSKASSRPRNRLQPTCLPRLRCDAQRGIITTIARCDYQLSSRFKPCCPQSVFIALSSLAAVACASPH